MKFLGMFTDHQEKVIDYAPIQTQGEEAEAARARRERQVEELKAKMGDKYVLAIPVIKGKCYGFEKGEEHVEETAFALGA